MSDRARMGAWDGTAAMACDYIACPKPLVLHVELSTPGSDYAAEADLCEEHLGSILDQARAFLVALNVVAPTNVLEGNIKAVTGEHLPFVCDVGENGGQG